MAELPGLGPLQRQIFPTPGQSNKVPDLILDAPTRQPPEAQAKAAQAQTTAPFQAPSQAVVQHSVQNIMNALVEMNIPPTAQNMQMAQLLASYGHPVNAQTMNVVQQAMLHMPDRTSATMEAVIILLSRDLPVTEKSVMAIKQFMNGGPLPQQLQGLQQELSPLLARLQSPQGQVQQSAQQAQQTAQMLNQPAQQVAQNIQSGQSLAQAGAQMSAVQQVAGQAKVTESRSDNATKFSEKTTVQKMDEAQKQAPQTKQVQAIEKAEQPQKQNAPAPAANPIERLPAAQSQQQDIRSLEKLYLFLNTGSPDIPEILEKLGPLSKLNPDEAILKLLQNLQQLLRTSSHLAENLNLKDYQQLFVQHQQIIQLTGLLETKLQEFHQLFQQTFPELAKEVQQMLQQDGMDIFSKLAQLIDESQHELLQSKLKLAGTELEKMDILNQLRQLIEQVGFQVEKVQAHLVAREMLTQNLPIHCIPLLVHANNEQYPAELYIEPQQDPHDPERPVDENTPFKITLTLETKNLGRISVDMATLKQDMNLDLKVLTRRVKLLMDERLDQLQHKIEQAGDYQIQQLNCRVVPDMESRHSMLLPPKRPIRTLKRVEGIV